MNRYLMGLMLALASTAATADCKQDCKEAYTQCSQGAGTLDDTMQCKKQYKACMQACNASGMAMAGPGAMDTPERDCDAATGPGLVQDSSPMRPAATR